MELSQEVILNIIITVPIFLFSLTIHETAHALTAKWGGDQTAAYLGRITLNPIPHIDPIGTILLPLFGAMSDIPLIGWAKPVPVMEQNFRRGDGYGAIVALAGPFSNLVIAISAAIIYQVYQLIMVIFFTNQPLFRIGSFNVIDQFFFFMILINIALMVFNLLPIPPLDGSHLLWHWVIKHHPSFHEYFFMVRQYGFFLLLALLWTGAIQVIFMAVAFPILSLLLTFSYLPTQLL